MRRRRRRRRASPLAWARSGARSAATRSTPPPRSREGFVASTGSRLPPATGRRSFVGADEWNETGPTRGGVRETVGNPRASRSRRPRGVRVRGDRGESFDAESTRRRLRHRRARLTPRHRRLLRTRTRRSPRSRPFKASGFFSHAKRSRTKNEKDARSRLRGRWRHVLAVLCGAGRGARARTRVLREARVGAARRRADRARVSRQRARVCPLGDGGLDDAFESPRNFEARDGANRGPIVDAHRALVRRRRAGRDERRSRCADIRRAPRPERPERGGRRTENGRRLRRRVRRVGRVGRVPGSRSLSRASRRGG